MKEPTKININGREYLIPFDVAEYILDLDQLMRSIHTRVVEERKYVIGPMDRKRPFIVPDKYKKLKKKTIKPLLRKRRMPK